MGIRPENIHEDEAHISAMSDSLVDVEIDLTEMMGAETYIYMKVGEKPFTSRINRRTTAQAGDKIKVAFDSNKIHLFDPETELAIIH